MNLMEESFQTKQENKKKNLTKIILAAIIMVVIIIISIMLYLVQLKKSQIKLYLNGAQNEKVLQLLKFEDDGKVYFPIKEMAKYLDYDSYNGEYSNKSEEKNKCYIQSENEIANFTLWSEEIYKLDLTKQNANYEHINIKNPVKAIDGVLYVSEEGLEKAFNVYFEYNKDNNRVYIYTMPYLIGMYENKILDWGYSEISPVFANQKTILEDMIVVCKGKENSNPKYAVVDTKGDLILEAKYDNITYLPEVGDFLVESNGKVGIVSKERETKVQIMYDSIDSIDGETGLYIAKKDNKYGVIDKKGNVKIYIENDEIGIDSSKFVENNIKNNYLLVGNVIPVRKDKFWALYDKNGNQLTEFEYDVIGYQASSNKDAINLLAIPDYNVLVVGREKKYTLLNSSGKQLMGLVADDIYMTISGGEKHYYILANGKQYNAEEYLDSQGITTKNSNQSNNKNTRNDNENESNDNNENNNENNNNQNNNEENSDNQNNNENYEENNNEE